MFTFIYAKHKIHPKIEKTHEQWYLLIDNKESFLNFIDLRTKGLVTKYWKLKDMNKTRFGHLTDGDMIAIEQLLCFKLKERKTIIDDCQILGGLCSGYWNIFLREGKFIVSPNNSFRNIDNTFKILNKVKRKELIFPMTSEKDIRILKWNNGIHYYAKIGNQDVVWNRKQKWDSHEEAYACAKFYLNKILEEKNK